MRVLIAHNTYRLPGGEDGVFRAEVDLLREHGHEVREYQLDNREIESSGVALASRAIWSRESYAEIRQIAREMRPDVAHFHNTLPLISPAGYHAARREGAAVVQTIHNFRLVCPGSLLFRDGRPCEKCVGKPVAWPSIVHACYRRSRSASAAVTAMLAVHRLAGTWHRRVDRYIALTRFAESMLVRGGYPAGRISVRSNFARTAASSPAPGAMRSGALFVGRLSEEKGVSTLLRAWSELDLPLRVVGDGPMLDEARRSGGRRIEFVGRLDGPAVAAEMEGALFLVVPSLWYECLPLAVVEAFSRGLPVIAAGHGSLAEVIRDGVTGRLFRPGDAENLAALVRRVASDRDGLAAMGARARAEYESRYSPEVAYSSLIGVYEAAIRSRRKGVAGAEI